LNVFAGHADHDGGGAARRVNWAGFAQVGGPKVLGPPREFG